MKTKFFKKLSFVLVVAMVLSLFVPAAGVFAAAKPSLNSKNKYLHLSGNPGPNEYNFNVKNKKKGWKYFWESSKENVAEVNEKNGVTTATGVGKTKITLTITDKNGEEIQTLSATVTVRDNIKEVSISNPVKTLAVGEEHDYNRSYVTEANSTKKTSSITRWTVSPDTATIDDKGVFVATEGGEYTVTALSFQSKAKYNDWKADAEKYADYVLDTDETKVVVSANIVGVTQLDKTKFTVEFDSSMKDTDLSKDTAMVYQIINGKQYNTGTEKIKGLSLDEAGKVATVEIFGNIVGKVEYQFVYGELKDGFTAADTNIKEVAGLTFDSFQVKTDGTEPVDLFGKVNAVNRDGVVILNGNDNELRPFLSFKYEGDVAYGWIHNNQAYITKNGETAKFTVTYTNFLDIDGNGNFDTVKYEANAMGTGVDVLVSNNTMQFAVVDGNKAPDSWKSDWKTGGFKIAADDENYKIFARYKKNTDPSWASYTEAEVNEFKYVSTDTDKLVIIDHYLYPIAQGEVVVLVQDPANNNVVIGAFEVVISSARGFASAVANTYSVQLGNATLDGHIESREIKITSTDTMNDPTLASYEGLDIINHPTDATKYPTIVLKDNKIPQRGDWDFGAMYFTIKADGATPGTYTYKLKVKAFNSERPVTIQITVLDSEAILDKDENAVVASWKVELDNPNVDLKEQKGIKDVKVNVYGYNARGARVAVLSTNDYTVDVSKIGGGSITAKGNLIPVVTTTKVKDADGKDTEELADPITGVTGTAISFAGLGSYVVTAKSTKKADDKSNLTGRGLDVPINTVRLNIEDTSELEVVREKASVSAATYNTVKAAVKEAFKVKLNGGDIDWDHAYIEYTLGGNKNTTDKNDERVVAGNSIRVTKIFFEKSFEDPKTTADDKKTVVTYTFNVNQTLTLGK